MDLSSRPTSHGTLSYYEERVQVASTYLLQSRRELLSQLPVHHPMRERTGPSGVLRPRRTPVVPRLPFTDAEIRDIKRRRNDAAPDPDNASAYLQRSQLVNMWNADYEEVKQREEYEQAQSIIEERIENSRVQNEVFGSRDTVSEKRRRFVSIRSDKQCPLGLLNNGGDTITKVCGPEEGEVVGDSIVQRTKEEDQSLRGQNGASSQIIETGVGSPLLETPPPLPKSETSDQSSGAKEAVGK